MNILQVIPYYFLSWAAGGPVELIQNLSNSLLRRGHQVTIYTTDAFSQRPALDFRTVRSDLDGVDIYEFKSLGRTLGQKYHICLSPAMIPTAARETSRFDVIHLHEYRTVQNIIAHHYARKHGVPYVLQAHGSLPRIVSRQRLKQIYDKLWGERLLRDASKVIAVTRTEAEQYESIGVSEDKIEIVPHGLDLSVFDNLPERGGFRRQHGLDADQKTVLYLGRIHKIKGLDLLVQAFADLVRSAKDTRLVITGPDDGHLLSLKRLIAELKISDRVIFTGALYGQEKLKAYVDADVYILPSYYEIFSITVLEACACGTPVIVTEQCGIADVIRGQAGFVVPYDKEQLVDALSTMLGNDQLRREFGEKGKSLVRDKFNWELIAEKLERVYQELL